MYKIRISVLNKLNKKRICLVLAGVLLPLILAGCGTATQRVYEHPQYKRGSHDYGDALFRDQQNCSNFAFKEGIRINGVTYFEYESAKEARWNYFLEYQLGKTKIPQPRHEEQYDYMNSRRKQCMKNRGWDRVTI